MPATELFSEQSELIREECNLTSSQNDLNSWIPTAALDAAEASEVSCHAPLSPASMPGTTARLEAENLRLREELVEVTRKLREVAILQEQTASERDAFKEPQPEVA
jgi:hypothetical protein